MESVASILQIVIFGISAVSRIKNSPIVNGNFKPVQPEMGDYPFHVSLMQRIGKKYHSFCGASLIHPRWILTAAHCIQEDKYSRALEPHEIFVALGSIYRSAKNAKIFRVSRTIIHPTFLKTDRNDIGLLKLKKRAKTGKNVDLIRLHADNNENLLKKTAFLTGFGVVNDRRQSPRRLRRATMHISSNDKCRIKAIYKSVEICGVSTLAEGKACDGDSGGPLFVIKNGRPVQVGITSYLSRSSKCEMTNNFSVYTKVSAHISWILKVVGVDFNKYNPS